jgi:hypothetical protein
MKVNNHSQQYLILSRLEEKMRAPDTDFPATGARCQGKLFHYYIKKF